MVLDELFRSCQVTESEKSDVAAKTKPKAKLLHSSEQKVNRYFLVLLEKREREKLKVKNLEANKSDLRQRKWPIRNCWNRKFFCCWSNKTLTISTNSVAVAWAVAWMLWVRIPPGFFTLKGGFRWWSFIVLEMVVKYPGYNECMSLQWTEYLQNFYSSVILIYRVKKKVIFVFLEMQYLSQTRAPSKY